MYLTLSQKTKVTPPVIAETIPSRYGWLSLDLVEPNLGVAPPLPPGSTNFYILTSDRFGYRGWSSSTLRPYRYSNLEEELSIIPVLGNNFIIPIQNFNEIGFASTILNGTNNIINIDYSFIGSGDSNEIKFFNFYDIENKGYNFIGSGTSNKIYNSSFSSILVGGNNSIEDSNFSTILNGVKNDVERSDDSTVLTGENNVIRGRENSTNIGDNNNVIGLGNFIGIGDNNDINGINNNVINGSDNIIKTNTEVTFVTSLTLDFNYNNIPRSSSKSPNIKDFFPKAINLYVERINDKYYAYVGMPFESLSAGKVEIYEITNNNSLNYLTTLFGEPGSKLFGYQIRSNNESRQLYISCPLYNNVGAIFCYDVDTVNDAFYLSYIIESSFADSESYFGHSFAVGAKSLLVGAPYHNEGRGVAFLYTKNEDGFFTEDNLQILQGDGNLEPGDNFGFSVDMTFGSTSMEESLSGALFIGSPNKKFTKNIPTPTPTPTLTPSITPSITISKTQTPSLTKTTTPSRTPGITPSITKTPTLTPSITPTITISKSVTPTIAASPSITPSVTISISHSVTPTITPTITQTPCKTPTKTPSTTKTITPSTTLTPSITPSLTLTRTPSPSKTPTPTITVTPSITPTITVTPSITPTRTISISVTRTPTISISPSPTKTISISVTPTPTISRTPSVTPTQPPAPGSYSFEIQIDTRLT